MPWNKGLTKENNSSVLKISLTMRRKKLDNFRQWREKMKLSGRLPATYPPFIHSEILAEYMGFTLGDGHISKFPRTERILLSLNSNNQGLVDRYARFTEKIFNKKPAVSKVPDVNNIRISLYQKHISKRLGIPSGNKGYINIKIPKWISGNKSYLISFLKGLFEAEASLSIHKPTCTYNFQFTNKNESLLNTVEWDLKKLGYHPERRKYSVRLRKKLEVEKFRKTIRFREY